MLKYTGFLPLPIPVLLVSTSIMCFFALGSTNFHFDFTPEPVHRSGNYGETLALNQARDPVNFTPMHQ